MRYMNGGGEFSRTLARAWSSQSARRRVPGIRLPREKRKAMVESFVKQYQQSNNGKFPSSLSLTRQEVGGSPLVLRHILQEVKVVWSRDQAQKPGLAQRSPQGTISTESQSTSVTFSLNGTVSMADEQHSKLDRAHHPVSDVLGAESKRVHIENLRKVDGDPVTDEKLNSDGAEVAGVQASGSEVKQPAGIVLEAYHLQGDVGSDRMNAAGFTQVDH
ncbi:unnamed protein product [Linum trigynum]|uniref:AT3G52170-like helix-turn-helix domain-containing protein n=1 Tax=Linum trigynum TaxID=586398 RepID=A0AAV2DJV7_9ROSI